jgi:hypothetical protein
MRAWVCFTVLFCSVVYGESAAVLRRVSSISEIRGAALTRDGRVFTWGDQLQLWTLPGLRSRTLANGIFSEGGCLVDLDGDGTQEFVGQEGSGLGKLTWRKPPDWKPVVIDDEFETHDCMEATLFGRKGILVIQRFMQVRFYERGNEGHWPYREIYSIYTPSQQTGLSMSDIDGDGRVDILCGNYWIRSPERFELPWHIFAVNTYSETSQSAMLAHALIGKELLVAQGHLADSRVTLFAKPEDPRKMWNELRMEGEFHRVHAVTSRNGAWFFGENNGASSRIFFVSDLSNNPKPVKIADGIANLQILSTKEGMISVGPREIVLWSYDRRK